MVRCFCPILTKFRVFRQILTEARNIKIDASLFGGIRVDERGRADMLELQALFRT